MPGTQQEHLALLDYVDRGILQEIQDAFVNVTGRGTSIRSDRGQLLTTPSGPPEVCKLMASETIAELCGRCPTTAAADQIHRAGYPIRHLGHAGLSFYAAEILVNNRCLGTIVVADRRAGDPPTAGAAQARPSDRLNEALGLLALLANIISRLAAQEYLLRRRIGELSTLYDVTGMLTGRQKVQTLLDAIARKVVEVMQVKASSIRLLDPETGRLESQAVCNLSKTYLNKGPVSSQDSPIDQAALRGEVVYVPDFAADPRVMYQEQARREGLASGLVTGMLYRGTPIGVMRIYTGARREFSSFDTALLRAVASQAAAAISNARLLAQAVAKVHLDRQMRIAGEVQRRMLPKALPEHAGLEVAGFYEPCMDVGGDYYDFIELPAGRLGVVVADVVGHGVPASLQMASLRSALRIFSRIDQPLAAMIAGLNVLVTQDTLSHEFITLFYGVVEAGSRTMRYINAGHEPPMLLREGRIGLLQEGGMVLGISTDVDYVEGRIDLRPGDRVLLLTDGVTEAINYDSIPYGPDRLRQSVLRHQHLSIDGMIQQMAWDVRRFVGLQDQSDDITLLGLLVH